MLPIARFEERYKISDKGEVLNLSNNTLLTPIQNPNGYLKVGLATGNGSHKQLAIHRLVALHYLPNPYEHPQINHKDGNKQNNNVSNLEWVSVKENSHHALQTGLRKGYMSANDKEKYLRRVLAGEQVKDVASSINRRPETLHKMLRTTADRLDIRDKWDAVMEENRGNAAKRNLASPNNTRRRLNNS